MKVSSFIKKSVLAACLAIGVQSYAVADDLHIIVDVSQSNPMLSNAAFVKRAAQYSAEQMSSLKLGDSILVQTFGELQSAKNLERYEYTLTRQKRKRIERAVLHYIMTLPERSEPQPSTNLLAWFNRNALDCQKVPKTILILSDGIEASEYVNPNKLMAGKQSLPAPSEFVDVKGCNVVMFGLGAGRQDRETTQLRKAWAQYFNKAGARFTAIPL